MLEAIFIPAGADCKAVEFDVVLDYMLIILHFQVVNSACSVACGVDGAKLKFEYVDELGPVFHPIRSFNRFPEGRLEVIHEGRKEQS